MCQKQIVYMLGYDSHLHWIIQRHETSKCKVMTGHFIWSHQRCQSERTAMTHMLIEAHKNISHNITLWLYASFSIRMKRCRQLCIIVSCHDRTTMKRSVTTRNYQWIAATRRPKVLTNYVIKWNEQKTLNERYSYDSWIRLIIVHVVSSHVGFMWANEGI